MNAEYFNNSTMLLSALRDVNNLSYGRHIAGSIQCRLQYWTGEHLWVVARALYVRYIRYVLRRTYVS